jgi:opine dehydrogenase
VNVKVAILGGGHGCYAAAADFANRGHEVRMWRRQTAIEPNYAIRMKDKDGERTVRIALLTSDIGDAVRGAELIVVPTPAFAQEDIGRKLAPHLTDGQVVFLPPGTFGSLVMWRALQASGNKAEVAFCETGTLPYLARKHAEDQVTITSYATRLPTGVLPARLSNQALEVLKRGYPSVEPAGDALSGALMNAGPIIHPPLILMNAGPLQHFPAWDIHNEGTQPAIRAVTNALDEERMRVREVLGYGAPHFPLRDHYENDQWMYGDAHKQLVDSGDWREKIDLHEHRYMTEDVHCGLAFLASVANWCGADAPLANGLLAIASAIGGKDLRRGPRTLAGLGLDKLEPAQLKQRLVAGEGL